MIVLISLKNGNLGLEILKFLGIQPYVRIGKESKETKILQNFNDL